jgi:hypothetical protein
VSKLEFGSHFKSERKHEHLKKHLILSDSKKIAKMKVKRWALAFILASICARSGNAEADAEAEAKPDTDPDTRFLTDDGLIFDDDAIVLVSPGTKNTENRAPRQYRGRHDQQRTAAGSGQSAKDLVSGKFKIYV